MEDDSRIISNEPDETIENEKMSPEEKLFRIIVAGEREQERLVHDLTQPKPVRLKGPNFFQTSAQKTGKFFAGIAGAFGRFLKTAGANLGRLMREDVIPAISDGIKKIRLHKINRGFAVLLGILVLTFAVDRFAGQNNLPPGSMNSFSNSGIRSAVPPPAPVIATPSENAASGIRLVGISWDQKGYMAMIEVGEGRQDVRFVRKGDDLPDGIKVYEIKDYTMTLSRGMRRWNLS